MKPASLVLAVVLFLVPLAAAAGATHRSAEEAANLARVERAFADWSSGRGSIFVLLSPDATWTILGPTPSAGTYDRPTLQRDVLVPFNARLASPLVPVVRRLYADADTVVVLFEASATLRDGGHYENSYAWFLRLRDGLVVEVTAVLDLHAYDAVVGTSVQ
ncbi:nuclear transport factor 2 family protein [Luteimonas suaedae]|uniref:nuclear transport factor 2 family protein n=1 Tax=Luteimonas suaedae TaxID=2605430 RepID=UPI0011EFD094|nr:nuclear transport factor 2 family protein [Luteimonas suaedae]